MAAGNKVYIIGIGDDGLDGATETGRRLIRESELLIGDEHVLALVPDQGGKRITVSDNFDNALDAISKAGNQRVVVLASGDPLFYGVARYLTAQLGKENFEVIPHVSSMQLAFARVKESWEDAYLTNLATRPLETLLEKIRVADKVGLFTSETRTPAAVAQALLSQGIDYFSCYVCENLGSPDERVTQGDLADMLDQQFAPLNVMILVRKPDVPDRPMEAVGHRLFGNPEQAFLQSRPKEGLLTPAEVRSIALAQLDLAVDSVVWDVGAGSGSLSIEAAQIATGGTAYAIEMDPEDHALILENSERFGVKNVQPVLGRAPDAWADLPNPDAVFVEGSGREINRLADLAFDRLKPGGRLVANVGSIQNLSAVHDTLTRRGLDVRVWMINVARGTYQMERVRFDPLQPTFLLAVVKPS